MIKMLTLAAISPLAQQTAPAPGAPAQGGMMMILMMLGLLATTLK